MTTVVTLSHEYDAPPARLWAIATDWDCLRKSVAGLIGFGSLPDEPIHKGQVIHTTVSLFGLLPAFRYTLEIREFDDVKMHLKSFEHGGGIQRWEHTIDISPNASGSRLDDRLEIAAGWRTPFVAWWARIMLARRHKPRLQMLRQSEGSP
jgi:hypothetical protein